MFQILCISVLESHLGQSEHDLLSTVDIKQQHNNNLFVDTLLNLHKKYIFVVTSHLNCLDDI